jgi:hypothetical protein
VLLVLAIVLLLVFGGLGFAGRVLWLGLILALILAAAHVVTVVACSWARSRLSHLQDEGTFTAIGEGALSRCSGLILWPLLAGDDNLTA